jgi:hypothetical protein
MIKNGKRKRKRKKEGRKKKEGIPNMESGRRKR